MLLRRCPSSLVRLASKEACELHRAVNGFRSTVREKDAIHPGPSDEFARERALVGVMKEIREVNGARGLTADYFHDAGMRMSERVYRDTSKKIEIFFPYGIENVSAAVAGYHHTLALVGMQNELLGLKQARVRFRGVRAAKHWTQNAKRQ